MSLSHKKLPITLFGVPLTIRGFGPQGTLDPTRDGPFQSFKLVELFWPCSNSIVTIVNTHTCPYQIF